LASKRLYTCRLNSRYCPCLSVFTTEPHDMEIPQARFLFDATEERSWKAADLLDRVFGISRREYADYCNLKVGGARLGPAELDSLADVAEIPASPISVTCCTVQLAFDASVNGVLASLGQSQGQVLTIEV